MSQAANLRMNPAQQRPQCRNCVYYYVTWDPSRPHGCRAMGFKANRRPSQVVYESSGMPCQAYEQKAPRKDQAR